MTVVLGIDPAWTEKHPSGVAVFKSVGSSWACCAVAPSYQSFAALAEGTPVDWGARPGYAASPSPSELIDVAKVLSGEESVDIITVDMPISREKIMRRRKSDDEISREFGAFGCSTHSPSEFVPGQVGKNLSDGFNQLGFEIGTCTTAPGQRYRLLEVYPHPALLSLLGVRKRVPYKASKTKSYWDEPDITKRKRLLRDQWMEILKALGHHVRDVTFPLRSVDEFVSLPFSALKSYEDALDALVCAWVGVKYLAGECEAFGNENAAIWVPTPYPTPSKRNRS